MTSEEAAIILNNFQQQQQQTREEEICCNTFSRKPNFICGGLKICKAVCLLLFMINLLLFGLSLLYIGSRIDFFGDVEETAIREAYKMLNAQNLSQYISWYEKTIYSTYPEQSLSNNETISLTRNETTKPFNKHKLVCYYNVPVKAPPGGLQPHWIDPFLCTHINLAFASIDSNTLIYTPQFLETFKSLKSLRNTNRNLKILISIGGAGNGDGFKEMLVNRKSKKQFILSVRAEHKRLGFDGIDLDYEFPINSKVESLQFIHLLSELRKSFKSKLLITVAVAAPTFIADLSYDIPDMNMYVDYVNLMSYDYHFYNKLTPFTGLNSPLYPSASDKGYMSTLNINYSATYWYQKGMDRNKIVIGLPTYGHSFSLANMSNHGLLAPVSRYGNVGTNGYASYLEIMRYITYSSAQVVVDEDSQSPYAFNDYEWISYDDEQSLKLKTEYIRDNQFGGAMVYALNTDDSSMKCINGYYRLFLLTNTIKLSLNGNLSVQFNC